MMWGEFFIAFAIAFVLSVIFGAAFRWERPGHPGLWHSIFFLFVIIFLATWAIGGWVAPVGPSVSGISWLSFLIIGLIVALILAAAVPPRRRRPRNIEETKRQVEESIEAQAMLGAFFWILFIALIIVLIWRHSYY